MAAPVVFIGPEVAASGWRLAGVETVDPAPGAESAALTTARQRAWMVLVCASVLERVDPVVWREARAATAPLLLVVPDLQGRAPQPDIAGRLRSQLGLVA